MRGMTLLPKAEALATTLDDHHRLGRVLVSLCIDFNNRCAYDQAIAAGERALVLARTSVSLRWTAIEKPISLTTVST